MRKENRKLLEEVTKDRLETALTSEDEEKKKEAFKEAMEAVSKQTDISNARIDRIIRCAEIGATVLLVPTIDYFFKKKFSERICNFEKDYTFTTTAGKSLGGLFRFKN